MNSACLVLLGRPGNYYLPSSYRSVIEVFRSMNNIKMRKSNFYQSCTESAMKCKLQPEQFQTKLLQLLSIILEVMIGKHTQAFNPLKYALSTEKCLQNHEAHHCLIFVLTLFGNVGLLNCPDRVLQEYRSCIYESAKQCEVPVLKQACVKFASYATIVGSFAAVDDSNDALDHFNLSTNRRYNNITVSFTQASLMSINQRRIIPIPGLTTSRPSQPVVMRRPTLSAKAMPFKSSYAQSVDNPQLPSLPVPAIQETAVSTQSEQPSELHIFEDKYDDNAVTEALQLEQQISVDDTVPPVESAPVEDDPMVKDGVCCICALPYVPDASIPSTQEDSALMETYSDHCRSEKHNTNFELYKLFSSEEKDYFIPKTKYLSDLLIKCRDLNKDVPGINLHITIEAIEEGLKSSEKNIEKIRNSASWKEGRELFESEPLESLWRKAEREIEEAKRMKIDIEKAEKQQAEKEEEEEKELDIEEEDEKIENTDIDYGEHDKNKKRKVKRKRKNKK